MMRRIVTKLYYAYRMLTSYEGRLFTYAFAYSLIVGLAPFLIVAVLLASQFWFDVDAFVKFLSHYIPEDFILPFVTYIKTVDSTDVFVIGSLALVSLWVASRSVYSFLLESSRVDAVGIESFILRIVALFYFVFIVLLSGGVFFLMSYITIPFVPGLTYVLVATCILLVFYRMISFRFTKFRDVIIGGLFAGLGLVLLGNLFFLYINDYSNYESIYGPMASLMILLISVYMISWVVYGGYCLNVVFSQKSSQEEVKKKWVERLVIRGRNWIEKMRKR